MCSAQDAKRILDLIRRVGLPTEPHITLSAVWEAIEVIRLIRDGSINFVLPTAIGSVSIVPDVERDELLSVLPADSDVLASRVTV